MNAVARNIKPSTEDTLPTGLPWASIELARPKFANVADPSPMGRGSRGEGDILS